MIINTNPGAAMAARILGESSSALQKSLSRLSSGSKIASPSDDAAGTGVAMKFGAQINRLQAARTMWVMPSRFHKPRMVFWKRLECSWTG